MELPLYDITTGTGDYIADGVVSHNCFARPTHEYLDLNAGRDFDKEIVVKVNVPEVLRAELARPSWKGEHVALGTNTDPYQWVEGRYKLMRGIWEAMRDFANPCSILTKSPLLLRDKDLLLQIAERARVSACLSVPTLDEKMWRSTEPHTPHPRARLEAVAELNRIGIPTGILIAPLMPGINDGPGQVEKIVELAEAAGATSIGGQALFLRGATRDVFFDWLRAKRPDLVERYEQLYRNGAYVKPAERKALEARLPGRRRAKGAHAALRAAAATARARAAAAEAGGGAADEPVLRHQRRESSVTLACRDETLRGGQCWLGDAQPAATQVRRAGARPPGPLDHPAHDPARAPGAAGAAARRPAHGGDDRRLPDARASCSASTRRCGWRRRSCW